MGGKKKHHQDKKEKVEEEAKDVEQKKEVTVEEEEDAPPTLQAKKVQYCPVCTLPFELCRYSKGSIQCASWLFKKAPAKVNKYHPDFKPEMLDGREESGSVRAEKSKEEVKSKSVKDKYVAIDVKNRGKKHYITTVQGLNNFNIDAKEVSKKCSKKFAVSCSVVAVGTIQMQGDNFETMRDFLLGEYKQLKKRYILDKEEFNAKMTEQRNKKKEEKKREKDAIQEQPEQEQGEDKKQQPVKDKNALRFDMMAKLQGEPDSDD